MFCSNSYRMDSEGALGSTMGFLYDPYRHFELIFREEDQVVERKNTSGQPLKSRLLHKGWAWRCHGCGAESDTGWSAKTPVGSIKMAYDAHLKKSHGINPEDTQNWSVT